MALGKEVTELQGKIGYQFRDLSYLENAMTHSSYSNEMRARGIKASSNERLEFLGDAVLELIISEYLFDNYSKYREGAMTKIRQRLVCESTLASVARRLGLGAFVNLGNGEEVTDCRDRAKILADCLEALIGAVYLDSRSVGSNEYKNIVLELFIGEIDNILRQNTDYKTMLQQLAEKDGSAILEYKVISEEGPEHNKLFKVAAYINNNKVGEGTAATKKHAEMEAARGALLLFGVII